MDPGGIQTLAPVPPHAVETPAPQIIAAIVAVALSFAALIIAFFGIPFYGLRERFRRDHFSDRLLAESRIEDTQVVPALVGIYEHVKQQMEDHPGEPTQASLLDVVSRDLIDKLLTHVGDYEELEDLYGDGILYGDLVWKFALATALMTLLFPALRFVWIVPPNHWSMTVYWMIGAVIGSGLVVTFTLYTRVRNRLMALLETHARNA